MSQNRPIATHSRAESWEAKYIENSQKIRPGLHLHRNDRAKLINHHCRCLICGADMDLLTYQHAAQHGYSDKTEFAKSGSVEFAIENHWIKYPEK